MKNLYRRLERAEKWVCHNPRPRPIRRATDLVMSRFSDDQLDLLETIQLAAEQHRELTESEAAALEVYRGLVEQELARVEAESAE
jgi:hypothetical protein